MILIRIKSSQHALEYSKTCVNKAALHMTPKINDYFQQKLIKIDAGQTRDTQHLAREFNCVKLNITKIIKK